MHYDVSDSSVLKVDLQFLLPEQMMMKLQEILKDLGYDVGKIDGILGAKTRQSVREIQLKFGFPADSWPTEDLLNILD